MTTHDRFDDIVSAFIGRPGVTPPETGGPRRFGSDALRVGGSVFCMVSSGERFVVKLPAERVRELIAAGAGDPFTCTEAVPWAQAGMRSRTGNDDGREVRIRTLTCGSRG